MKSQNVKTVYAVPVERMSPQGRHNQVYSFVNDNQELVQTRAMKRTKEEGVSEILNFPRSISKSKLLTGLEVLVPNVFKGLSADDIIEQYGLNSSSWRNTLEKLVVLDKIRKQTYYEILDGVDEDYYTSKTTFDITNPASYKNKDKEKTYLEQFSVILYDRPNPFTSDSPRGRLAIQLLEQQAELPSSKVAGSKNDVNPSTNNWYLTVDNEEEIEKTTKRSLLKKAMHYLYLIENEYSEFDAYKIASILTNSNGESLVKGRVSASAVQRELDGYINSTAKVQEKNIQTFVDLFEEYKSIEMSERCLLKYYIQQALNTGIFIVRDSKYLWPSQSAKVNIYDQGYDFNKMLNFFIQEYKNYNPDDKENTNYFHDLYLELLGKNVRVE